jgi:CheY-like chemotaxis protein
MNATVGTPSAIAQKIETEVHMPEALTDLPPRPHRALRPRVLVVDDDRGFLDLAVAALAAEGVTASVARTAGEALFRAVGDPPDLILLDILLPDSDGLDLLEALRAEPETRDVPIFACTALGERESAQLLTQVGFDGLLAKPVDLAQLARVVRSVFGVRAE